MIRNRKWRAVLTGLSLSLAAATTVMAASAWIEELGSARIHQGYGKPGLAKSTDQKPIAIDGKVYLHGLGTHSEGTYLLDLAGQGQRFTAAVGLDDESRPGSVRFMIEGDGRVLFDSGVMKSGDAAKPVDISLEGVKTLALLVTDGGDGINYDHADWADAKFEMKGDARPVGIEPPASVGVILTPPVSPKPRINGAKVFGVRPGHSVLFTIPATGERPMTFAAEGLPAGLALDTGTGRFSGSIAQRGEYAMTLIARNAQGEARRPFKIVVGDNLALTPPMGWNSWNCWAGAVDQDKVLRAGKAMVSTGLINHGWSYVNIDDCWESDVGGDYGATQANARFPDMKKLCNELHTMGLKAGLYSSPGPKTCAQFTGSYQHEAEDARQWAEWGFDYIKYDWCSYGQVVAGQQGLEVLKKPYRLMGDILKRQNRDIVYSLCQYGMGHVSEWGAEVGGQCWRTTGDITDTWGSVSSIARAQEGIQKYISPGHWNDGDMLVLGMVGWGPRLHPTRLTPDEQYSHISLWCLLSSPLLIGCDMERMDGFTLSLLTNDEVLEVNQDPAARPAVRHPMGEFAETWVKPLEDGSFAIGLFNRSYRPMPIRASWNDLGITGKAQVRDLWRQTDVGSFEGSYEATVQPHGVALVKVTPVK